MNTTHRLTWGHPCRLAAVRQKTRITRMRGVTWAVMLALACAAVPSAHAGYDAGGGIITTTSPCGPASDYPEIGPHTATSIGGGDSYGNHSYACRYGAIAIGTGANAEDTASITVGYGADALGAAVAIGAHAQAKAYVLGVNPPYTIFGGVTGVAIGSYAVASANKSDPSKRASSVAIGGHSQAVANGSVAVGQNASAGGPASGSNYYNTALGAYSYSAGVGATAVGGGAVAVGNGAIAIGGIQSVGQTVLSGGAFAEGSRSIAIGSYSHTSTVATGAVALGNGAVVEGAYGIAAGDGTTSGSTGRNVAIGSSGTTASAGSFDGAAVAIGRNQVATDDGAVAIGQNQIATETGATAIGNGNNAAGTGTLAMGNVNYTGGAGALGMGNGNRTSGTGTLAIGNTNRAGVTTTLNSSTTAGAVALGSGNTAGDAYIDTSCPGGPYCKLLAAGDGAVAIGQANEAEGTGSIALGSGSKAVINSLTPTDMQYGTLAFGYQSSASNGGIAMGSKAVALDNTIAIGANANGSALAVMVGTNAKGGWRSVAIGANAQADPTAVTYESVAIGYGATASTTQAGDLGGMVAIGQDAHVARSEGIALGKDADVSAPDGLAVGVRTKTSGAYATALGYQSEASGDYSVALGNSVQAIGSHSISIGTRNTVNGANSGAIGDPTIINGTDSYSVGNNNNINANDTFVLGNNVSIPTGVDGAVALGSNSSVTQAGGVALGDGSVASTAAGLAGYDPSTGAASTNTTAAWKSTVAAISVGDATNDKTRQITGVAAGSADTDAVNIAQLKTLAGNVTGSGLDFAGDTGTTVHRDLGQALNVTGGATGTLTSNNIAVTGNGTDTLSVQLAEDIDLGGTGSLTSGNTVVDNTGVTVSGGPNGAVTLTNTGLDNGGNKILNVANGAVSASSTDAVNGSQLFASTAAATTEVQAGTNVASVGKTTATDGHAIYTVNADGAALDTADSNLTLASSTDANHLTTYTIGLADSITVGSNGGAHPVTIDGDAGTITGLTNKTFDPTNFTSGQAATEDQLASISSTLITGGLDFAGDTGTAVHRDLGTTLNVTGGETDTSKLSTGKNIGVVANGTDTLSVQLASNLTDIDSITINNGPVINQNGIDMGGDTIINLGNPVNPGDAVNLAYFNTHSAHYYSVNSTITTAGSNYANDGATGQNAIAVGPNAQATADRSLAMGYGAQATSLDVIAIGNGAKASLNGATALGHKSTASGSNSIALGYSADAQAFDTVSVGVNSVVSQNYAGAFGGDNTVAGRSSYAVGFGNTINADNVFVLGNNITVPTGLSGAMVLGNASTVAAAVPTSTATINGVTYSGFAGATPAAGDVVSVGSATAPRQIQNVAAGQVTSSSTDAINGSQLYAVANELGNIKNTASQGWNLSVNGDAAKASNVAPGATVDLSSSDGNIVINKAGTGVDLALKPDLDLGSAGSVTTGNTTVDTTGVTVSGGPNGTVKLANTGLDNGGNKILHVANGDVSSTSTDAVNGSQLFAATTAAATEVKAGTNVASVTRTTAADGHGIYTVNADGTAVATAGTNLTLASSTDADHVTTYTVGMANSITIGANGGTSPVTVNGNTGTINGLTNKTFDPNAVTSGQAATEDQLASVSNTLRTNGMDFAGDSGTTAHRDLGTTLTVKGGATGALSTGNIGVTADNTTGTLTVQLAQAVNLGSTGSVTTGATTVNNNGVMINGGPSVTTAGIDAGGQRITDVAPGTQGTDAVNVGQLNAALQGSSNWAKSYTDQRVNTLRHDANAGIAGAMAMSGLGQAFLPNQHAATVGAASFEGESAIAVGLSTMSDTGRYLLKLSGSANSRGDTGAAASVTMFW